MVMTMAECISRYVFTRLYKNTEKYLKMQSVGNQTMRNGAPAVGWFEPEASRHVHLQSFPFPGHLSIEPTFYLCLLYSTAQYEPLTFSCIHPPHRTL